MGYVSGCRMNSPQAVGPVTGRISSAIPLTAHTTLEVDLS